MKNNYKFHGIVHEAELGGLFENCQKVTSMKTTLSETVHPQPQAPVAKNNTAANSIVNGMVKQKYPEKYT